MEKKIQILEKISIEHLSNNDYEKFQSTLKVLSPLIGDNVCSFTTEIINIINDRYARNNFSDVIKIYEILFDYTIIEDFLSCDMSDLCDKKQRMSYSNIGVYRKYYFSLLKYNDPNFNFNLSRERYTYYQPDTNFKYKHNTLVNFGQYKSFRLTISKIIDIDPTYILWCIVHVKFFVLSYDILTDSRFIKNHNYYTAVEINNLKWELSLYYNLIMRHSNKLTYKLPFLFLSDDEINDEIIKLYDEYYSIQELSIGDPEPSFGNDPKLEKISELIDRYEFYSESYFPNISDYICLNNTQIRQRENVSKK